MNINKFTTLTLLIIGLSFSTMQATTYAADNKTIIGPTKSPLSKTKTLETESSGSTGRRNDYDDYGRGYNGYNNTGRNLSSSTRPKTTQTLQRNTTNKQAQEAARQKALPGGTKALSPTNTRTTQSLNRNTLSKPELEASKKKSLTPTAGVRNSSSVQVREPSFLKRYERNFAGLAEGRRDVDKVREYLTHLNRFWGSVAQLKSKVEHCKEITRITDYINGSTNDTCDNRYSSASVIEQCYERELKNCLNSPWAQGIQIPQAPSTPHLQQPLVSSSFNSVTQANNRVKQQRW